MTSNLYNWIIGLEWLIVAIVCFYLSEKPDESDSLNNQKENI